jgi:hypothetical protein
MQSNVNPYCQERKGGHDQRVPENIVIRVFVFSYLQKLIFFFYLYKFPNLSCETQIDKVT